MTAVNPNFTPYPTPVTPETHDALMASGFTPTAVKGVFLSILRQIFADPRNLRSPALSSLQYVPPTVQEVAPAGALADPASSLLIIPSYEWNPKTAQQRPAIAVKQVTIEVGPPLSLANREQSVGGLLGAPNQDPNHGPMMGDEVLTFQLNGGIEIMCISTSALTAEILGFEVMSWMLAISNQLIQSMRLMSLRIGKLSPVQPIKESDQHYSNTLNIAYAINHKIILRPQSTLLKSIRVLLNGTT